MSTDIDLRTRPAADHRDARFDAPEDAAAGDELDVVTGRDVDPDLVRYQIDRERTLDWTYGDPDADREPTRDGRHRRDTPP